MKGNQPKKSNGKGSNKNLPASSTNKTKVDKSQKTNPSVGQQKQKDENESELVVNKNDPRPESQMSHKELDLSLEKQHLLKLNDDLSEELEELKFVNKIPEEDRNMMKEELDHNAELFLYNLRNAIKNSYDNIDSKKVPPKIDTEDEPKKKVLIYTPQKFLQEAHNFLTKEPLDLQQGAEKIHAAYSMAFKLFCHRFFLWVDYHDIIRIMSEFVAKICEIKNVGHTSVIINAYRSADEAHSFFYKSGSLPNLRKCFNHVQSFVEIYDKIDYEEVKKELLNLIDLKKKDPEKYSERLVKLNVDGLNTLNIKEVKKFGGFIFGTKKRDFKYVVE